MEQRLVDKKDLTEQEIRTRYITPAIRDDAGWPLGPDPNSLHLDHHRRGIPGDAKQPWPAQPCGEPSG
jgi:type I site-specific restriction endonuclease